MKLEILKFIAHSKTAIAIAVHKGWRPGARYTNHRDIRTFRFSQAGFLDIDWKAYCFHKHVDSAIEHRPLITIARDVDDIRELDSILDQADLLSKYCKHVAIVPKDAKLNGRLGELIPKKFILAYSVPTRYGGTSVSIESFDRPVHLLGGRPDVQRRLAENLKVFSLDCNRFTLDAKFGDYFDGEIFRPHPEGGYEKCLEDSITNINGLWKEYVIDEESSRLLEKVK